MKVKNTIPNYADAAERDILIQKLYVDIQKLIYENQKNSECKEKEEKI